MTKRDRFYTTREWRTLRARILERDGGQCQIRLPCCQGLATQVDHIEPRSVAPDLAMTPSNLRSACAACNQYLGGKLGASRTPRGSARTRLALADGFDRW